EDDRVSPALQIDLLLALRDRGDGQIAQTDLIERRDGRGELALAAVDQDEIGKPGALLVEPPIAPPDDLGDALEVVRPLDRLDLVATVVGPLRLAAFPDDHR